MSQIECRFFEKISRAKFMKEYWGRRPLFVKGGATGLGSVVSAKQIFELAANEAFTSRLISTDAEHSDWQMDYGPFQRNRLSKMGKSCWTVLVQEIDREFEALDEVRRHFQVTPNWMFDDIMVSFAKDLGSVGPHFDQYDVFLIQGEGTRTWKLSRKTATDEDLLEGFPIKVLGNFRSDMEFECEPGDVLYIPPHIPHYGISHGDSTTFSVGFRKPTERAVMSNLFEDLLEKAAETVLKMGQGSKSHPAEIDQASLRQVRLSFAKILKDDKALTSALAREISSDRNAYGAKENIVIKKQNNKKCKPTELVEITLNARAIFFREGSIWRFYINGQELVVPSSLWKDLKQLFNERRAVLSYAKVQKILEITNI